MQFLEFCMEVQKYQPADAVSPWLSALWNDRLVRTCLEQTATAKRIFADPERLAGGLSLASVALTALGLAYEPAYLSQASLPEVEAGVRQKAIRAYEAALRSGKSPKNLEEAGLLALALRERRRVTKRWTGLPAELASGKGGRDVTFWATPLAVLFGLVPDPDEMLMSLPGALDGKEVVWLVTHVLLSNPLSGEERLRLLMDVLERYEPTAWVGWLKHLQQLGQQVLVNQLAQMLLARLLNGNNANEEAAAEVWSAEGLAKTAYQAQVQAALYHYAGQPDVAEQQIRAAQDSLKKWQAALELLVRTGQARPAGAQTKALGEISSELAAELTLAKGTAEVGVDLPDGHANPLVRIYRAVQLRQRGEQEVALEMAGRAVDQLVAGEGAALEAAQPQICLGWNAVGPVDALLDLGLTEDALRLARHLFEARPLDLSLIRRLSDLYEDNNDLTQAQHYARLALMWAPEAEENHRRMGDLLERGKEFEQALEERRQVLHLAAQPQQGDWLAFARSALAAEHFEETAQACERILEQEPNHEEANRLMGQAMMSQNQPALAVPFLSRATLMFPESDQSWILLAEAYQRLGDVQRGLETLRAGVLSAPNSSSLNFLLSEAYLAQGSPSESLPYLRKAANLQPTSLPIALKLGRTLTDLGYLSEALRVLEEANRMWPQNPELSFALGNVFSAQGEFGRALPLLETAIQAAEAQPEWFVRYAENLLSFANPLQRRTMMEETPARLETAQEALNKALLLRPDDFHTQVLQAELQLLKGEWLAAEGLYQELSNYPEAAEAEWHGRLQAGLGRACAEQGKVEAALAFLREAAQGQPHNLPLQRLLSEVYWQAGLTDDAMQSAKQTLRLAPNDLDQLSWFAELSAALGNWEAGVEALQTAAQLENDNGEIRVRLAEAQLMAGDILGAQVTLQELDCLAFVQGEHLRRAAYLQLRLGNASAALAFLQHAQQAAPENRQIRFETAGMLAQAGSLTDALDLIRTSDSQRAKDPVFLVFEADLLAASGRYQAAAACVEQSLRCEPAGFMDLQHGVLPEEWLASLTDPVDRWVRLAVWNRANGETAQALNYAEMALEARPEALEVRVLAAECAWAMMDETSAAEYVHLSDLDPARVENLRRDQPAAWAACWGLTLEHTLNAGNGEGIDAAEVMQWAAQVENARLWSAAARLQVRAGNWTLGRKAMDSARRAFEAEKERRAQGKIALYDWKPACLRTAERSLVQAWMELEDWEAAAAAAISGQARQPEEPRANYDLVRTLVLAVKRFRLLQELRCVTRLPGMQVLGADRYEQLDMALTQLEGLWPDGEVQLWRSLGQSLFQMTPQNVRGLVNTLKGAQAVESMILILRQLRNCALALQVAQQELDAPEVALQAALCHQEMEPQEGVELARGVVARRPNDPLGHVVLALLAEKSGDLPLALAALEKAVGFWPDEPEWQVWAGQLAESLNQGRSMLQHLEAAAEQRPEDARYAVLLARAYLEQSLPFRALELLSKATRSHPDSADLWMTMARTYRTITSHREALECAELACRLEAESAAPALLCSEICMDMNDGLRALAFANEALRRDPAESSAALLAGRALVLQGQERESLRVLSRFLAQHPDQPVVLFEQALLVERLEGVASAMPLYQRLTTLDAQNAKAFLAFGRAKLTSGDVLGAEKLVQTAIKLDSGRYDAHYLMGRIQRQMGQLDQAIYHFSEAVRLAPAELAPYLDLGATYLDRRETLQALQIYQKATQVAPEDPRAFTQAGILLRDNKDYLGAEAMLRKAAHLAPGDVQIRKQLGAIIALNLVHNPQEAKAYP